MTTFFVTKYEDTVRDGGRDGLGLLPIWSRVARRCIWNVTSISRDLAGWRSLLVAAWLAERVTGSAVDAESRRVMLAAERLIGLARRHAPDAALRDTDRLRGGTRLDLLDGSVRVSGDQRIVILKGQASTGVVGQVGRPAVRSGLLSEELSLDDDARDRLDRALAEVVPHLDRVRGWLLDGAPIDLTEPPAVLNLLARGCSRTPVDVDEAAWLLDRVVYAARGHDPDGAWSPDYQATLARALLAQPGSDTTSLDELPSLLEPVLAPGITGDPVRAWLADIRDVEALLGRMDDLFAWLRFCTKQAQPRSAVADALRKQWQDDKSLRWIGASSSGLERALVLLDDLGIGDELLPFASFVQAVQEQDADACIRAVLDRNEAVSSRRDRRPWVSSLGDSLRAELTSEQGRLRFGADWVHTYYLAELQSLVRDLRPALAAGGEA